MPSVDDLRANLDATRAELIEALEGLPAGKLDEPVDGGGTLADLLWELGRDEDWCRRAIQATFEDRAIAELEGLECLTPEHATLRDALLRHVEAGAELRARLAEEAGAALEMLSSQRHVTLAPPVRRPEDGELALACLTEELAKLAARRAIRREVEEAMQDITGRPDESLTWRLGQAAAARHASAKAVRSSAPSSR